MRITYIYTFKRHVEPTRVMLESLFEGDALEDGSLPIKAMQYIHNTYSYSCIKMYYIHKHICTYIHTSYIQVIEAHGDHDDLEDRIDAFTRGDGMTHRYIHTLKYNYFYLT